MDLYNIIIAPDPVLKSEAQPVSSVNADIQQQIDRMLATMYDAPGIGLAANQVGLLNRIFVMDCDPKSWEYGSEQDGALEIRSTYRSGEEGDEPIERARNPIVMVNPEILWRSEQRSFFDEGCLSLPGQFGTVERPAKVRVKYLDYDGNQQEMEAEGLVSHCVQHELDHLNGVLFVDYLSGLKRNMIIRRMEKLKKQQVL
ncbi:MAG: peptide deformylase [Alphaproteobacteria bacterium]|nr:peptide deformylase [Alphaproteobacteria bacterium]